MKIEICGGIASGKTTLCGQLVKNGYYTILEDFSSNPFWELFYQDPVHYAFETEVTFHLQHYNDIKRSLKYGNIVCDFSLLQDVAYADVNLSHKRHNLFCDIAEELRNEIGFPEIIIHLYCPEAVQLKRIIARKRVQESKITAHYLATLNTALKHRLTQLPSDVKVIHIDSDNIDFRDRIPEVMNFI